MTTPEPREDHELAACPFCGGENVRVVTNTMAAMSWVACPDCGLETPTETGTSAADAVAYWNRRPSPTPSIRDAVADGEGLIERLRLNARDMSAGGFPIYARALNEAVDALLTANTGRAEVLEEAARVVERFPDYEDEPWSIPARPATEDEIGFPEQTGFTRRFTKPVAIAAAIRALKSTPTDAVAVEEDREVELIETAPGRGLGPLGANSPTEAVRLAYGLLWHMQIDTRDPNLRLASEARKALLWIMDKDDQADGIARAKMHDGRFTGAA